MRKILFLMALVMVPFVSRAQMALPDFSTEESQTWYTVEFKTGGHFLTDNGNGAVLVTANAADSFEECWAFIGNESEFVMKSRIGNYVYFDASRSRFAMTNDASKAGK